MLQLLYLSGTFVAIFFFFLIANEKNKSLSEKILLFSVAIIPLGKLIYFPIPGLIGLKIQFLLASLAGLYGLYAHGIKPKSMKLLWLLILPAFSILWLEQYDWLLINHIYGEEQADSVGLRIVTFALLITYFMFIYGAIIRNPEIIKELARKYIYGTIAACAIGVPIFIGVWFRVITVEDLLPISADTHIVDLFYRFNPGSNVNEFSMVLAYAIFLLPFSGFVNIQKKYLLFAFIIFEFATLTRASWIALVIAFLVAEFFKQRTKRKIGAGLIFAFVIFLAFFALYLVSPEIQDLIVSRTTLDIGASGDERLEKFQYIFDRVLESPFRLVFGFGWATNLYAHNVYLQILYELGIAGLLVFSVFQIGLFRKIILLPASSEKSTLVAVLIFIFLVGAAHHTLYHLQTWLMLAVIMAISECHEAIKKRHVERTQ